MGIVIFIIFLAVVTGILALIVVVSAKQTRANWQNAANRLKLRHYPGNIFNPGILAGTYHTHHVKISTFSRGNGKNSQTYTKFYISYGKPIKFKFKLTKQNLLHSFGKIFGMEDIQVGDQSFDKKVLVQGADHLAVVRFLTAPRRNMIKSAMRIFPELKITDKYVEANIRGIISAANTIIKNTENLTDLADILSRKRKKHHPIKKAKKARAEGDIAKAVNILKDAELQEEEDKLEAMELQGEMLYISNSKEKAKETFSDLVTNIPNDNQAKAWKDLSSPEKTSNLSSEISTKDNDSSKESSPPQEQVQIAAEDLCKKLFDSGLSTFDATKLFEEKYQKQEVEWSGKLISAFAFSFDFIFKNSSGVKATFEIMELNSEYSTAKIKAIVHFHQNQLDTLKKLQNKKVTFSGKLKSVDALMKNIFISKGALGE